MRLRITICLFFVGIMLMLCGCSSGDSSQEIGISDAEAPITQPSELDEKVPSILPTEPDEHVPDGNHDATEPEYEIQEKPEGDSQKVCIVLDETRQKAIDDLLGTEELGLHKRLWGYPFTAPCSFRTISRRRSSLG